MQLIVRAIRARYFSDVGDRNLRDRSISPNPTPQGLSEVDAINNNTAVPNTDPTTTRKMGICRSPRQELNATRRRPEQSSPQSSPSASIDLRLNEWLINNNIDSTSRTIILGELFTYNDFLFEMDKSDLLRIGLK